MTDIDIIFSTQIRYLVFFNYFYNNNVFIYSLFGISTLSLIYLLIRPSDKNSIKKMLAKNKGTYDADEKKGLKNKK
jgi:hypothetical protein